MELHDAAKDGDYRRVEALIASGCAVDELDELQMTPLAYASQSPQASVEILKLLIDSGANPNFVVSEERVPIGLAAASGSIAKVQLLLDSGADIHHATKGNYSIAVLCVFGLNESDELCKMLRFLHANGASLDVASEYGESPLSVASRFARFDAVKCLLDLDATETPLGWNRLMKAVVWGTDAEFQTALNEETDLSYCDRYGRSAWHLTTFGPYLEKAKALLDSGMDVDTQIPGAQTVLMLCAERGNVDMLKWLIEIGANLEATDDSGTTALMIAAGANQAECLRVLLEAGANPSHRDKYGGNAMSITSDTKVLRLLEEAGEDLADLSTESKRPLLGFATDDKLDCSVEDYLSGCYPRFGASNPELMEVPFWKAMVRCGWNARRARIQLDRHDQMRQALWCFDRFGMSFTKLSDGRFVQIAGEHEDYYDPDFCIYNDVIVHDTRGNFKIYGYPKDVFPPTDFHSATLVDGFIYIIGSLGYSGTRRFGETPVYRFNIKTWSIESVQTRGDNPGWIYKHRCRLQDGCRLIVTGGTICKREKGKELHEDNTSEYELDLRSWKWNWK